MHIATQWRAAHAARLERWLGPEMVQALCHASQGRDLEPIPIAGIPGGAFTYDGDIIGSIQGGSFASLSDLAAEMSAGKGQILTFSKAGVTKVVGVAQDLWAGIGTVPPAAAVAAGLPTGTSPTNNLANFPGCLGNVNPAGGDTLHFIGAMSTPSVGTNLLLLYDRFFHGNHTMTVDPRTVTGIPTRYQDATARGNFIGMFVTTILPAATPTYTVSYIDDAGNAPEAAAAQTIVSAAIARRFPFATTVGGGWRIPLNAGDLGVRALTNLDLSAAMASGACDVFLGKPIGWIPQPVTFQPFVVDGINSMMNLKQIVDNACLALMEVSGGAVTATNYNGYVILGAG